MNTTTNEQVIRVGLVDDQNLVRTGFAMVIDSQPDMQVVVEAANGKLATERLEVVPTDVVLMDIRMPVMDGLEAAHAIRSSGHPDAASIPIIAMSADAYDEDVKMSMEAGMDSHIAKPIAPDRLFSELARLCAKRGAAM